MIKNSGQATIEYLLVFAFATVILVRLILEINSFFGDSIANLNHVLSLHLTTGVCESTCFSSSYSNGAE